MTTNQAAKMFFITSRGCPRRCSEERECYEVAQELRDMAPSLRELVVQVLDVENGK
jgi:hypothetical protein